MEISSFTSVHCIAETSRRNINQYLDVFDWYLNKNHIRDWYNNGDATDKSIMFIMQC
jgi:hypothetical protein